MNPEPSIAPQQALLNQVLAQGIKRNEEQTKIWSEYENGHKEVIESLEMFAQRLSVNCMVPVGKRALIKGKLTHTNEILACIGEGYLAKYSAVQAIELCRRRIEEAGERLKSLEKEKNLLETRQAIPMEFEAFGEGERKDLIEYWDQSKLQDWRVEHRKKEKEYRQKLLELKKQKKTEIRTEEDLFNRLDELELEEELADEINRLKANSDGEYDENSSENDNESTSETDSNSADETTAEMIEKELEKLREIKRKRSEDFSYDSETSEIKRNGIVSSENETKTKTNSKTTKEFEDRESKENFLKKEQRRVSFSDEYFEGENKKVVKMSSRAEIKGKETEEDDDVIRIEFKHSENVGSVTENKGEEIESPRDVYRIFSKPKSILKRSPNDINRQGIVLTGNEDIQEENEEETAKESAYKNIVKDIQEKKTSDFPAIAEQSKIQEKRTVSKFRKERAGLKS